MDLRNRFTDRARKVMQLANQEAQRFNHEYVGTEHILLGLIKEGSGVAANVLKNLDVDLQKIRLEVEKLVQSGPDMVTMANSRRCRASRKSSKIRWRKANLNHNYVGTEHILLGLLRDQEGVAALLLTNLGLSLEGVRKETMRLLNHPAQPGSAEVSSHSSGAPVSDADKEFYLRVYRSAVAFYKPRIEKRTGVLLGDIAVWDFSKLHQDRLEDMKRQASPCASVFSDHSFSDDSFAGFGGTALQPMPTVPASAPRRISRTQSTCPLAVIRRTTMLSP